MQLNYSFDDIEYSWDSPDDETRDYVKRNYTNDELLILYLNYMYSSEPDKNKKILKDEFGFDGTKAGIAKMNKDLKDELVDNLLFDIAYEVEEIQDSLKDYFELDAQEDFYEDEADYRAYQKDPMGYNGVSWSDFI